MTRDDVFGVLRRSPGTVAALFRLAQFGVGEYRLLELSGLDRTRAERVRGTGLLKIHEERMGAKRRRRFLAITPAGVSLVEALKVNLRDANLPTPPGWILDPHSEHDAWRVSVKERPEAYRKAVSAALDVTAVHWA